jgi:clan AA aspartic protease (TIGR02281 family)
MWVPYVIDVLGDIALGILIALVFLGPVKPAKPADVETTHQKVAYLSDPPVVTDAGGGDVERIEAKITDGNRCPVRVTINGETFDEIADSGAPDLWFPVGDVPRLGLNKSSLHFEEMPGEGKVAWVTLPEIRIGDFVARNVDAAISYRQTLRLLGMSVLRQGHMEVKGDKCALTFPRNVAASRPAHLFYGVKPGRPTS